MIAIPKKAATVILLRKTDPKGFEVFLLKRHEKSSFMGGNYVYPGGRVDREDGRSDICSYCKGLTLEDASHLFGGLVPPEESYAHWIAGIRELFEEAGVLLAYDRYGEMFQIQNQIEREKFSKYRGMLQKGTLDICQMVQEENLLFALDRLIYYAHWITPEARSERFDTRFFVALHPEGQEASYDQKETTAGIWLTPRKALEENLNKKVALSPPTLKTLEDLSRFESIDEVFKSINKSIKPVLPILTKISSSPILLFPLDSEYETFKQGTPLAEMDQGRPSQLGDNTTRLILKEDFWIPFCKPKN